ncbi:hypothetical protein G9464_01645 [Halostella sp. JP-L12]|uniref:heme NO-binding domain-containing protein n=1 Tax=Halostella TaxID=1843185 RepID=UPI000EF83598|nr:MULTISPECIES: heme NO-binding domain-containing protein [Halostella]NHN46304.1 hypothetical protein [Halostella sp. JP-L12]
MHGIIHKSLKSYVEAELPEEDWDEVMDAAGIEPKLYLPVSHYPDEEVTALLETLAERNDRSEPALQEDFGEFLAPELLDTFKAHVRDDWRTADVLENLETIYAELDGDDDEAFPPDVDAERVDGDVVTLVYPSGNELCPLGKGIVRGIAASRDEAASIDEAACLLDGDDRCELTVTVE